MGFLDRFRKRPVAVEDPNPWVTEVTAPEVVVANPWKPEMSRINLRTSSKLVAVEDVWRPSRSPSGGLKTRVLHSLSAVLILVNVVVGLFFYSNNMTLNVALLGYLGVSTILLGHYFSLTR